MQTHLPCDVVIVGGGPAGTAAGIMLKQRDPNLKVILLEQSDYDQPRIGESLHPVARQLFQALGIEEAFFEEEHVPCSSVVSCWGSAFPEENHFLFQGRGSGWHLNRNRFDSFLAKQAEKKGVTVLRGARFRSAVLNGRNDFKIEIQSRKGALSELHPSFVLDASGSTAQAAISLGARHSRLDCLVGIGQWWEAKGAPTPLPCTSVEAWSKGWWYVAPIPQNKILVSCMTDADLCQQLRLNDPLVWNRFLRESSWSNQRLEDYHPHSPILIKPATSRILEPLGSADGWLALGDAACSFDPLSSQGIIKGIRQGIFGAYACLDSLQGQVNSIEKYSLLVRNEFNQYRKTHWEYYFREQRWPEETFWKRRHGFLERSSLSGRSVSAFQTEPN